MAFDRGHQRGFLAADERAGAQTQLNIKIKSGAQDVFAQQAIFPRLSDSNFQPLYCDGVFGADINVTLVCADSIAGDSHCLQHHMGVAFQNGTIHERSGVAFVSVAADVFLARRLRRRKAPFYPGGEAAAAPSAQAGVLDGLDHLVGGHFGQHFAQRHVAVHADVFVDVFRVNDAAVFQRHTFLFRIKLGVVQRFYRVFLYGFLIQKAGNDPSFEQMLGNDFGDVFGFDHAVKGALRVNNHDGA